MTPQSAKAKGRNLCKLIKDKLIEAFYFHTDDVKVTSSGSNGEDIQLSPYARIRFPFSCEMKNHAKMAIYSHYDQAVSNCNGHTALLVVKANHKKPLAVLDFDDFLKLVKEATK